MRWENENGKHLMVWRIKMWNAETCLFKMFRVVSWLILKCVCNVSEIEISDDVSEIDISDDIDNVHNKL